MRLAEKTIELNFCSQYANLYTDPCFWFGLTQRQEAQAGFDAAVRLGGRLHILQFKASSHNVSGLRRFHAPNGQLENLVQRSTASRCVFYVLPEVGTTLELAGSTDLMDRSWLLDANDLRDVAPPVTPAGRPRKNQVHYFDLEPPLVHIHAPSYEKKLVLASEFARVAERSGMAAGELAEIGFKRFWTRPKFTGTVAAFVVVPAGKKA
jgi:hypothetical protein